jgi:hypothetical protein
LPIAAQRLSAEEPQPKTPFEQEAAKATKEWTIKSNSLFPLFSPVQKNLRKKQYCIGVPI